jgi:hypothetical protein
MLDLADVRKRREEAARWYANYRQQVAARPVAETLTDADVDALVHELR